MAASVQRWLIRSASLRRAHRCLTVSYIKRTIFFKKEFKIDDEALIKFTRKIDISEFGVNKMLQKSELDALIKDQTFNKERLQELGPDIAAATFLVARGGAVKFGGKDPWVKKTGARIVTIPKKFDPDYKLEGIDCSNMRLHYVGLDNLVDLEHLRYIDFSNGEFVDDWFLARLQAYRESLEFLDISGCSRITEQGLLALHHLRNLKVLKINNCEGVRNQELVAMVLEDHFPDLQVIGVDKSTDVIPQDIDIPDRLKEDMKLLDFQVLQSRFLSMGDILDNEGKVTNPGAVTRHYNREIDDLKKEDPDTDDDWGKWVLGGHSANRTITGSGFLKKLMGR